MKRRSATAEVNEKIALLKIREVQELDALKQQFHATIDSLKPVNLIKNSIKNATSSPGIKSTLVKGALGLATAYFSKRIFLRAAQKPVKKIVGSLIGMGIARFITKKVKKEKEHETAE